MPSCINLTYLFHNVQFLLSLFFSSALEPVYEVVSAVTSSFQVS